MAKNNGYAPKGSKRMMQILVNEHCHILNEILNANLKWLSPLESDNYKEFQLNGEHISKELGLDWSELKAFWPTRQPQWDGLAISHDDKCNKDNHRKMATEVKYIKDSNIEQLSHEQNMITDVLKAKVKSSSGKLRNIKLPKYIFFRIKDNSTLLISIKEMEATIDGKIIMKNPVCENMQEDNAAFEGWAICLKSWLACIEKVELTWDIPLEITLKRGASEQHYNRFCYRVMRFKEAYKDWFGISDENKDEIVKFAKRFSEIRNNAYSKEPEHKPSHNGFGETDMEFAMANDFDAIMKSYFNIEFIDRQFPVGLKKADKQFFTGGLSAIDLWGSKDDVLSIIELKYIPKSGSKNIKVGIISELFLYSCVMRDIAKGVIHEPSTPVVKETEKLFYKNANNYRKVCAYMLANEYHPLVENKQVFSLLNSNTFSEDIPVSFQQCHYIYNETTKQLSIAE